MTWLTSDLSNTLAVIFLATTVLGFGYGMFWRNAAEKLWQHELDQAFGPLDAVTGADEVPPAPAPVAVTPHGDGGMDALVLEALMPAPRFPHQRTPGGLS
jgi:hypothetical protein